MVNNEFNGNKAYDSSNKSKLELLEKRRNFINLAHEVIKKQIAESKFNEADFIDDDLPEFSTETVNNDIKKISELKVSMRSVDVSKFGEHGADLTKKVVEIFEFLVFHQIRNNSWLNESSEQFTAYLASNFDDFLNGVDIILEKKNQDGEESDQNVYGVSIDVTYGTTEDTFKSKFKKIEDNLYKANPNVKNPRPLPRIKYFKSEFTGYQGPIENMANLVIGANHEHILDLFSKVFKDDLKIIYNTDQDSYKQNKPHPFNFMMLEQIWAQCSYLKCIAKHNNHSVLYKKYVRMANVARASFSNMLKNVDNKDELNKYFLEDASHQMILQIIEEKLDNLFATGNSADNRSLYGVSEKPETRLLV